MSSKSLNSARPRDLRVSEIPVNPDWQMPSGGRHHVFLFDGTWNDANGINLANFTWSQARRLWVSRANPAQAFAPVVTNVVKTHHALAADSATQLTHYFRGVGNDDENSGGNKLSEGALARDEPGIRAVAYCEFLRSYRTGDRISILGFSRGAASARLFARDLMRWGLMDKLMIESRYTPVRHTGDLRQEIWQTWPKRGKKLVAGKDIPIAFLGVWDTVAATMSKAADDWRAPANVRRAVHCVALDETRELYAPTLLSYEPSRAADMKEVWFAGVHSDIGGGYFTDALGRLTLDFMWRNWNAAVEHDGFPALAWNEDVVNAYTSTTGLTFARHNESPTGRKLLVGPRSCGGNGIRPRVHSSVEDFVQRGGLLFCEEDTSEFPPVCRIADVPYQPLAYPGADAVELYASTTWA